MELFAPVDLCPLLLFVVPSKFLSIEDILKVNLTNCDLDHFGAVIMLMGRVRRKERGAAVKKFGGGGGGGC